MDTTEHTDAGASPGGSTTPANANGETAQIVASAQARGIVIAERPVEAIPVRLIRPSSVRQPREAGLAEDRDGLRESMKTYGQLEAIWVRTRTLDPPDPEIGDHVFELVFGERRSLCATDLGWSTIRAEVHDELDDFAVYLLQLEENEQRKALSPLEQADAVARLMAPKSSGGFGVVDTAEIAARLNVSVPVVYQRLALAGASPKVRAAFARRDLFLGSALAIAVVEDHAVQDEIVAEVPPVDGEPVHVRRVMTVVERFLLRLPTAPFDTTADGLVDGVGPCGPCPKRSGAPKQLALLPNFAVERFGADDRCIDGACFAKKRAAWAAHEVERARKEGIRIVEGTDAHALYPAFRLLEARAPGLVDLDEMPPHSGGRTRRTILDDKAKRSLDGLPDVKVVAVVVDGEGGVHYLADKTATRAALAARGFEEQDVKDDLPRGGQGGGESRKRGKAGGAEVRESSSGATPPEKPAEEFAVERRGEEAGGLEALGEIAGTASKRKGGARFLRFIARGVIALMGTRLDVIVERRKLRDPSTPKSTADAALVNDYLDELKEDEAAIRGLLAELVSSRAGLHPEKETEKHDEHPLVVGARFFSVKLDGLVSAATKKARAADRKAKAPPKPAPEPAVPEAPKFTPGTCSACGCTDSKPCMSVKKEACVWADRESTLCSKCAHLEAAIVEAADTDKAPTVEELDALVAKNAPEDFKLTGQDFAKGLADAAARRKVVLREGRVHVLKSPVVEKPKPPNAGATPAADEVPLRTRIVLFMRERPEAKATRRELLDGTKAGGATPSDVLREIAHMQRDKLLSEAGDTTAPIALIAPTYERVMEELELLGPAEVKARWSEVMQSAPMFGVAELRHRIAVRLSGEWRKFDLAKAPPPDPKGKDKPAAKPKAKATAKNDTKPAAKPKASAKGDGKSKKAKG